MRLAAVAAILIFVCWCAALALAREPKLDAELAQARYVVYPPATAAAVPASSGNVSTSVVTLRYFDPVAAAAQEPTTAAVPVPTGDANGASTAPAPVRVASPVAVVVDAHPVRETAHQVTATVPPPAPVPPVNGDCESWRPLLNSHGIPYDGAARIMWRESGCAMVDNYNPSTRDDSLCAFQLNRWGALDAAWTEAGFPRWYMATPEGCVDAAALYYHACGWGPWVKPYDCPGGWPL